MTMTDSSARPVQRIDTQSQVFAGWLTATFVWMFLALALTGVVGWFTLSNQAILEKVSGLYLPIIIVVLFSFNSRQGACPSCDGIGSYLFDRLAL